ncbi:hypothetical protein ACFTTN_13895 [Streptomyces niveus]|uniref:hypothetical protein n=1 Tax=Streptomyces niveus TaxID=193462 RepID=UPI0036319A2A
MELEVVAAFTAAGVAAVAVPATLLVGRWQMRATLRSAEATARAGLAQAEATYRSTLDAVKAQASATQSQWRRGVQRESYAAFLLAVNQLEDASTHFFRETHEHLVDDASAAVIKSELRKAEASLRTALLVVTLEGPETVAETAEETSLRAFTVAKMNTDEAESEMVWQRLIEKVQTEDTRGEIGPATALHDALNRLAEAVEEHPGLTISTSAEMDSVRSAFMHLPAEFFTLRQQFTLMHRHLDESPMATVRYGRALEELDAERIKFVRAARAELDANPGEFVV